MPDLNKTLISGNKHTPVGKMKPECAPSEGGTCVHSFMANAENQIVQNFCTGVANLENSPCCPLRCHSVPNKVVGHCNRQRNCQIVEQLSRRRRNTTEFSEHQQPVILARPISYSFYYSSTSTTHHFKHYRHSMTGHLLNTMTLFLLLLLSLSSCSWAITSSSLPTSGLDIVSRCQQNCPQQLNLDDDLDIACNSTCKIEQCEIGCEFWHQRPLSCFDVCQNTSIIDNWIIYCAIGCNHAHTVYVEQVKSIVGTPPAPKLVAGSLSNDSLAVEWKTSPLLLSKHQMITYRVQMKYTNISSTWTYALGDPNGNLNNSISGDQPIRQLVKGLNAYTSYQFRIEWVIVPWLRISLFSSVSEPLTTLPYGVPSTPCLITSCLAISDHQISVSWKQPNFPNGPIIAYTLYLKDNSTSHKVVKDLQMHSEHYQKVNKNHWPMNYVFNGLKADTEYTVSIVTFNNFGEGPVCERRMTTLPLLKAKDNDENGLDEEENSTDKPVSTTPEPMKLFIASNTEVGWRNPHSLSFEEIIYHLTDYAENHEITGMAIHVRKKYLFVSDSSGTIRRVLIKENSQEINQVVRIINGSNNPSQLSIDWLNDKLYMVEESRISRCNLDGEFMESVVTGFRSRPHGMKVDPYNGYLFWLLSDATTPNAGLYRIDLADLGQNKINYASAQMIYQSKRINTFAVSYFDYRIYFPIGSRIYSITIDGKDAEAIRDEVNSNSPEMFIDIENMIIFDRRLYFTNGSSIYSEDYLEEDKQYFHNSYSYDTDVKLVSLLVMDSRSQPFPVPLNPVEKVQAVFLDTTAKISWEKPALFGGSGRGAWQDWHYEVSIEEAVTSIVHLAKVNNITSCVADELKPDTEYSIKVRAWSASGKGTWSDIFNGATLPSLSSRANTPYAVVATKEGGLLKTDLAGKLYYRLVPKNKLNSAISEIVWYKELLILNTDNSLMVYNQSGSLTRIGNITNAASVKVDWYAGKLYWSNPFERMICRANIDGTQMEILPIITHAKEIAIDSQNGFLYWSTMYAIKYSLLNGMKKSQGELYRATEIKSITVNSVERVLYWVAINSQGESQLYRRSLLSIAQSSSMTTTSPIYSTSESVEVITTLPDWNLIGPVATFADRLFWRQTENNEVKISDSKAKAFATIKELKDVSAFDVIDYHQNLINSTRCVVPEAINVDLVEIEGTWENFTLFWAPVVNVNYGQVFYDLVLEDHNQKRINIVLSETNYNYPNHLKPLKPFSKIKVAIRPFTYWASAKQVVLTLHTPSSIPSKPRDIRVFTEISNPLSAGIIAEARWRPPADPNGIILSYTVSLWNAMYNNKDNLRSKVIENQLSYRFEDLLPNATYYFEVRATTESGEGPPSEVFQFKTFQDASPSRLLLAESNSILLADMDLRQNEVITKSLNAKLVDYLYNENLVYWVEEGNFLKKASLLNNSNFTLIAQLHEQTTGLAIDWIGRRLYLSTVDRFHNKSTVWMLDFSDEMAQLRQVTSFIGREITCLRVNPFSSELVWSEVSMTRVHMMATIKICRLKNYGSACASYRDLFADDKPRLPGSSKEKSCNCTYSTTVGKAFAFDYSLPTENNSVHQHTQTRLVYFDLERRHFASTDLSGCQCRQLTPANFGAIGTPSSLALDQSSLYWKNDTSGTIYRSVIVDPSTGTPVANQVVETINYEGNQINSLVRYNRLNQPSPIDSACLIPHNTQTKVHLEDNTAFSLTLRVEVLQNTSSECGDISQASLRYRTRYRKHYGNVHIDCRRDDEPQCQSFDSFNDTFTITDLEPYTNYTFSIELDNYYLSQATQNGLNNNEYNRIRFNNAFVFSTAESRPGPPRNVRAVVETPEKILILWDRPEKLNSNQITYEVWWYSVELNRKSVFHSNDRTRHGSFFMYLENVKPGKEYNVSVRAYADNHQYMESLPILVRAYEEPAPLTVAHISARSVHLHWDSPQTAIIEHHQLFVQGDDPRENSNSANWTIFLKNSTRPNSTYDFRVNNLLPNTRYRFQMALTYAATKSIYTWPRKLLVVTTLADVPDVPTMHQISEINNGNDEQSHTHIYKVSWDQVKANSADSPVYYTLYETLYEEGPYDTSLEESTDANNSENSIQSLALRSADSRWNLVYNGTDTYWVITGLESGKQHLFRLAANNNIGRSNYTSNKTPFFLPFQYDDDITESNENMLIFVIVICSAFIVIVFMIVFLSLRRYKIKEKSLDNGSFDLPIELRPWHELPSHPHQLNTLYINSNAEQVDLADIKIIDNSTIIRGKILGKGAFGEVFEGILQKTDTKVAIKVLNKGSSDSEQINFLKEAKFMSKFKHPNILQLLGVCLNAEQPIIVMELMEGGDLLNYLRRNRPSLNAPSPLTMDDMLGICIDVAKGCEYLEQVSSVHRDLAARNCLVSSIDRTQRVVKIADFGLTRGLYKQNYYRKEGGLLPVRWMAPESLVDGVFTTQSDVWSFGIVMYEVMVFGEQPYQGLSNEEVLKHVREGKTLMQPTGCPYEIFNLMRQCWSYNIMERPKFADILRELENIRTTYQTLRRQHFELGRCFSLTTVHNQNYISALERLSMHSNSSSATTFSLINPHFVPYNNMPILQHQTHQPHQQTPPHHHLQHHHHHPTQQLIPHFHPQHPQHYIGQQVPQPLMPTGLQHSPAEEAYLYPNSSRLTSATLVLEPSLNSHSSTSGGSSRSSSHSSTSHTSTPNLMGPYLNANGRPATIYEGHNSLTRSIDIEGYQIPIRT